MTNRPQLRESKISPAAGQKMATFHAETIREIEHAILENAVVVVGMAQNPHVRNVRNALTKAKVAFTYLEYGSYLSEWRKRLAIKLWSGWPTFPQVFVRGTLIGGEDLTKLAIANHEIGPSAGESPVQATA